MFNADEKIFAAEFSIFSLDCPFLDSSPLDSAINKALFNFARALLDFGNALPNFSNALLDFGNAHSDFGNARSELGRARSDFGRARPESYSLHSKRRLLRANDNSANMRDQRDGFELKCGGFLVIGGRLTRGGGR